LFGEIQLELYMATKSGVFAAVMNFFGVGRQSNPNERNRPSVDGSDVGEESQVKVADAADRDAKANPEEAQEDSASCLYPCKICKGDTTYLNVCQQHFFICEACRVSWCGAWRLFSSWQYETQEDWDRNIETLKQYRSLDGAAEAAAEAREEEKRLEATRKPAVEEAVGEAGPGQDEMPF
jgi:hypothetical protein